MPSLLLITIYFLYIFGNHLFSYKVQVQVLVEGEEEREEEELLGGLLLFQVSMFDMSHYQFLRLGSQLQRCQDLLLVNVPWTRMLCQRVPTYVLTCHLNLYVGMSYEPVYISMSYLLVCHLDILICCVTLICVYMDFQLKCCQKMFQKLIQICTD